MKTKALKDMGNIERARLLADLFPEEIPRILKAIEKHHFDLIENRDFYLKLRDRRFVDAEFWYGIANGVYSLVMRKRNKLTSSRQFANQLFAGDYADFTADCIVRYAKTECEGSHFYYVVTAFFDTDWTMIEGW